MGNLDWCQPQCLLPRKAYHTVRRIGEIRGAMRDSGLMELEAVVAVARCRNFRAAAADLGKSRSALSHSVAVLEQRLGVRLFHRTTRSVSLTEAGELFVSSVSSALAEISSAMEVARSRRETLTGTLRIKSFGDAAHETIAPVILQFLRRYREMKVDVLTNGGSVDIVADGFVEPLPFPDRQLFDVLLQLVAVVSEVFEDVQVAGKRYDRH